MLQEISLMPKRLLIDTACSQVSVFYGHEGWDQSDPFSMESLYCATRPEGGHDRFVFDSLHKILAADPHAWKALTSLGVCIGPGRFNGVRVGCSVIATFMAILKLPCYAANSFQILQEMDLSPDIAGYAIFAKKGFAYYQAKGAEQKNVLVPFAELPFTTHVLEIEGDFIQSSTALSLEAFNALINKGQAQILHRPIDIDPLYCALI
jgi:tRNA A37 threonylcarbamoyladenosine modification protein TsaB